MRKLTTSLSLLVLASPGVAFAQEAVTLDEIPTEEAPAGEEATEEAAPTEASASASGGLALSNTGTEATSATTAAAPPAPAATEPAPAPAPAKRRPPTTRGGGDGGGDKWEFSYSGYFRAPMRIGIANNTGPQHKAEARNRNKANPLENPEGLPLEHYSNAGTNPDGSTYEDGDWTGNYVKKRTTLHRPVIPDDQYSSWQFTSHNKNAWAEMFFGVGNGTVAGYLAVQAFQFTDSTWKFDNTQFGIGQGWVEIDHDLGYENIHFNAKVGSHWARYGLAGIYDAGEFDTYIIGRTHLMGGTARLDITLPTFDLGLEGGIGGNEPNPKMFNRTRFTMAGHGHVFFKLPSIEVGLHGMHAWASASTTPSFPNVQPGSSGCAWNTYPGAQCTLNDNQIDRPDGTELAGGVAPPELAAAGVGNGIHGPLSVWGEEYPTGKQTILGVDSKFDLGLLGYLFFGASHQILSNALTVGDALESIHSLGAGEFNLGVVDNYLESPFCHKDAPNESCSNGDGSVTSAMLQYELGLGNFGIFPGSMDLKTKLYGMLNYTALHNKELEQYRLSQLYGPSAPLDDMSADGDLRYKFGIDLEFFPLDWMSAGLRFDHLNPTNNKIISGAQNFSVLSPRITFRTKMVTHEQISLSYSRYFYAQRECEDSAGNVASPADDRFRSGDSTPNANIWGTASADPEHLGLPLRHFCVQPPPAAVPPTGFGSNSNTQDPGLRGAPTLLPDENVIKLEASMWW